MGFEGHLYRQKKELFRTASDLPPRKKAGGNLRPSGASSSCGMWLGVFSRLRIPAPSITSIEQPRTRKSSSQQPLSLSGPEQTTCIDEMITSRAGGSEQMVTSDGLSRHQAHRSRSMYDGIHDAVVLGRPGSYKPPWTRGGSFAGGRGEVNYPPQSQQIWHHSHLIVTNSTSFPHAAEYSTPLSSGLHSAKSHL